MPRFYFNLFNDVDAPDPEGEEHRDLAAAKAAAITAGREMMAAHLIAGRPIHLHHRIEVADETGKPLAVTPFREIITVLE